ncbi:MAG TPA: pyridoxal phosphate-dependent aminotransferase [Candidatus Hydrogenedentes bacterium]|nr:pyridoxal phosphate-dependent aminotransferase [Candidatus Hydrogenedentota bacterium]
MFSRRFDSLDLAGGQNELARTLHQVRTPGNRIFDLTQSNPTQAGLVFPEKLLREALSGPGSHQYCPDPKGMLIAREVIVDYYAARGWEISADQILLTSGTSEAYSYLLKLFCNPGDAVLAPTPGYPLLDFAALMETVELGQYPLTEKNSAWRIDFSALRKCIRPNTKALVWIQPNNPTGTVAAAEEAEALVRLAEEYDLCIIVDEVFSDYCRQGTTYTPIHSTSAPVFTLNGISKILGLPQLKLSWILMEGAPERIHEARERLEIIADTYLSVNTPVQVALPVLMNQREAIQREINGRLEKNEDIARELLEKQTAFRCAFPAGGWYLVLELPEGEDDEVFAVNLLKTQHVYVHPGCMFGFRPGFCLVISLLTPPEEFKDGMQRILFQFQG